MALSMSYEEVISSKPFIFFIGPERKAMTVHSGMVSHHSSALDTLVNGPMAEAKAGEATWDDVDTGTFARFSQWGYTRDYTSVLAERLPQVTAPVTNPLDPEPDFKPSDDAIEPSPVEHLDETRYSSLYLRRKGTKKRVALHPVDPMEEEAPATSSQRGAWLRFKNLTFNTKSPSTTGGAERAMGPADSHEEVFLCHVRLYVLAEKWDIQPLKTLSKAKLHQALINFNLFAERVGDIVALLRYLYVNTPDNDGTKDDLRDLVMHYVVCHYTTIAVSEDFLNLMDEGGEWVRDCLTMLSSIIE